MLDSYPGSANYPAAQYWLSESLYRRGDYSGALAHASSFLENFPDHHLGENALDTTAWCLEQLGRYGEAAQARESFIERFADSSGGLKDVLA